MRFFVSAVSIILSRFCLKIARFLGKILGLLVYTLSVDRKKIALLNLSRAFPHFSSKKRRKIALGAFQNLAIVAFEMCLLAWRKEALLKCITFREEEEVFSRLRQGGGIVILSAHQANWEFPIIALSQLFPGVAVAKPFKNNLWLYNKLLAIRQMFGCKLVVPKTAVKEGIMALKRGEFFALIDQRYARSKYFYPLFGAPATSSIISALLAYKTNNPVVVLMPKRVKWGYEVTFAPLLFPHIHNPYKIEIKSLMDQAMQIMETNISERPEEWMWMHERWKIMKRRVSMSNRAL